MAQPVPAGTRGADLAVFVDACEDSTRQIMRKVHIIREIDVTIFKRRGPIDNWNIGVTGNPDETRKSFSRRGLDISRWRHWRADSSSDATAIGDLFRMLGMQPAGHDAPTEEAATVFVF